MNKFIKILISLLLLSASGFSQKIWELGGEYQYNSGQNLSQHDVGIRYDGYQNKNNWNFGITYNFGNTKSKDAKETGIGISAGYRYGFSYGTHGNLFAGARVTFEFDQWKDKDGKALSKETVIIPKIETGYHYIYGTLGHGYATPSIGYGYGIMVSESGTEKKADEGGRIVTGLSVGYRF